MASFKPYSYIQCPCFDATSQARLPDDASSPTSEEIPDDDDNTFDPRSARSKYSLYPIEYLLYCVDCNQIRCPRCVSEELVTIYCPSCLFEVGSSSVKTEGNRYVSHPFSNLACAYTIRILLYTTLCISAPLRFRYRMPVHPCLASS